jgi:hypothetical protein
LSVPCGSEPSSCVGIMVVWISALLFATGLGLGFGLRIRHRLRRQQVLERQRRVEEPNSFYSAPGVRRLVDLERWRRIPVAQLHPLNQDEVRRLLRLVKAVGPDALSSKERQFLDNMARQRAG